MGMPQLVVTAVLVEGRTKARSPHHDPHHADYCCRIVAAAVLARVGSNRFPAQDRSAKDQG